MDEQDRCRQIFRLGIARLKGGLSQEQMVEQIAQVIDPQRELPLGVGAATEAPGYGR